ncbi:MAG: prepilin-type N-terminal cleavage/methylation domain-containing protein [Patescibacteria group bacterium]
MKSQAGATLIELLVYLGISSFVVLGSLLFLVQMTTARLATNDQKTAQQSARLAVEKMTYSLRNAYDVVVNADGTRVTIYSNDTAHPGQPVITVYGLRDGRLMYGQSLVVPPDDAELQPILNDNVEIADLQFKKISASLQVSLSTIKSNRQSSVESTIAFRQK